MWKLETDIKEYFSFLILHYIHRGKVSCLNPEHPDVVSPASQCALGITLSHPSELWYYRWAAEPVDAVNMNFLPHTCPASVLITEPSPQPENHNF